jgi:two-component system, OmpR family, response regulator ResD
MSWFHGIAARSIVRALRFTKLSTLAGRRDRADRYAASVSSTSLETISVLIVEDDSTIADVVVRYLEREGFAVRWAAAGDSAIAAIDCELPDLVVLDVLLPRVDGFGVLRALRERAPVPVVMLSALGEESDRVLGLELGADDYLAKPFSPRELVARIKAVLRRAREPIAIAAPLSTIVSGDVVIDIAAREVRRAGRLVTLTAREFELLVHFARRPRLVQSREQLFADLWGYTYGDASTVTVHIRRLREKIEADPSAPTRIVTVWGQGYRWDG